MIIQIEYVFYMVQSMFMQKSSYLWRPWKISVGAFVEILTKHEELREEFNT